MLRRVLFVLVLSSTMLVSAATVRAGPCWRPPVAGVVTDPFRKPPCPYCAGNRGIEYRIPARTTARAVASGTVTWAGVIAGTRYVVVVHANGWRATYGKLGSSTLGTGDAVLAGQAVGTASMVFYFGLRDGDRYVDPAPHLGRLVGRPRLVPTDGTAARPAPPAHWTCDFVRPPASRLTVR